MDRLDCTKEIVVFFFLVLWTTSDSFSHGIVATCNKAEDEIPAEMFENHKFNPSPLHEVTAELNESQTAVVIRWSINIDSSIRSLTGTWIQFSGKSDSFYRCQYQPPFASEQISLTGQEQLWFSFTVPDVSVCPSTSYYIVAYNLPPPSDGENSEYGKHAQTAQVQWNADIYSVLRGDKISVTFNTSLVADRHTILLRNTTHTLKTVEGKGECKVEKCEVELEYMDPCEDLKIWITPHFKHCHVGSQWSNQKVVCPNTSSLDIGAGCVLALLFVLLCCCISYQISRRARGSRPAASVRVLLVYPAVDGVFQRSVMLLAERLQSRGAVSVVIDVWERGSLAEQGPLRWLNSQADLAERVLIVSPPPRTLTDDLKAKLIPGVLDDTVSASASNLFALALNLVTSAARDPHGRDKFWVVNLDHAEKNVQTELRGCRTFVLPRDLKKLHRQLLSGVVQSPALPRCFRSFYCKNALEQLERNTDFPSCEKPNCLDKNPYLYS